MNALVLAAALDLLAFPGSGTWDADSIARRHVVWVERADTVRLLTRPEEWSTSRLEYPLNEWGEPLWKRIRVLGADSKHDSAFTAFPVRRIRFATSNGDVYMIEERRGAKAVRVSSLWRWR